MCGCGGGANRVRCIVGGGGDGSWEVEERPVRMRAFQAIVRGKVVSEDAHDCFKVPLYIGNEQRGAPGYQVLHVRLCSVV